MIIIKIIFAIVFSFIIFALYSINNFELRKIEEQKKKSAIYRKKYKERLRLKALSMIDNKECPFDFNECNEVIILKDEDYCVIN